jgi:DNA-binding winged helix-turn-helix (wHTH) protein/tetratricopeptide (TPR) repeat protein
MDSGQARYRFGDFELKPREHVLTRGRERVALTPKAFDLLTLLVERHGTLVGKEEILTALWPDTFVEEANLPVHVAAVRRALGPGLFIETIPKRGYRFVAPVETSARRGQDRGDVPAAPAVRLTVLPFRTLNADRDTEFLAYGFPDAVAGSLADHPWLIVRTPYVAGRSGTTDTAATTPESADAVLQGTLIGAGSDARIRINLVEVPAGTVLLSRELIPSLATLFDLQAAVARDVAETLARGRRPTARAAVQAPASPAAYVCYLRANQLAYETSRWNDAGELYEACVRDDPSFAPGWARLARVYRVIGKFADNAAETRRAFDRARGAFDRALALDPDLSIAHSLYAQLEVDVGQAERAMCRLIERARRFPHAPELYSGLVHALRYCGLLDLSVGAHHRARALDPAYPTSVHHTWWMQGAYEQALAETFGDIGYMPGLALASLGRTSEAIAALQWRERESGDTRVAPYIASLRALLEDKREDSLRAADRAVAQLVDAEAVYYLARTYAWWRETARALDAMARVVEGGFVCCATFDRDPWLDSIRREPRFRELVQRARERSSQAAKMFEAAGGHSVI